MFCPKCGNKLEDNAKFCHICGQPIETDNHQPQQPDYQNFGNYQQQPQPKKSQKGFVAMVIAAGGLLIVLVVVAAMIALGVGRGSDSQKEYADGEEVYLEEEPEDDFEDSTGVEEKEDEIPEVVPLTRPSFLGVIETIKESVVEPEVNGYKVKSDLQ